MTVIYRSKERKDELFAEAGRLAGHLASKLQPARIIVFGSAVASIAGPASDIDIIVVKDSDLSFRERRRRLYEILDSAEAVDAFWYTHEELEQLRRTSSFVRHALREGMVVYEA